MESTCAGWFDDHTCHDPDRRVRDRALLDSPGIVQADFGWCITAHKAQGSEWESVAVLSERMRWDSPADRNRWLYTAITRAADSLLLLE